MCSMNSVKYSVHFILLFLNLIILITCKDDKPCIPRMYNGTSIVCVCNATYCDTISQPEPLHRGKYVLYSSSLSGKRFEKQLGLIKYSLTINTPKIENIFERWLHNLLHIRKGRVTLKINRTKKIQTIVGFGGAFTDASGINIRALSKAAQKKLIDSYFSKHGLEYNMARVPIGASDFSQRLYAYNMEPKDDISLSNFSLTEEDFKFKIPIIQKALKVSTNELYLIGAVWSPPIWMKTNKAFNGFGLLQSNYYQTYANYHIKFLEEYNKNNISFWAISTGNEPLIPVIHPNYPIPSLGWYPTDQAKWLENNLGPSLKNSKFRNTLILAYDDNREHVLWYMILMSFNVNAVKYIDGISLHWYTDYNSPAFYIDITRKILPNKFLISTEACIGSVGAEPDVELGSWERAEIYASNIIQNLNNGYVGWIDWNLALNKAGGPNYFDAYVDSTILVLPENDEFIKQPTFYSMGHFSKFVPRGSKRISIEILDDYVDSVAFLKLDDSIVVIFINNSDDFLNITVHDDYHSVVEINSPPHTIHTLIYR